MSFTVNDLLYVGRFLREVGNEQLPFKTSYKINKLTKEIEDDLQFFEKKRVEIIEEKATNEDEMREMIAEVLNTEIDAPKVRFNIEEFADIRIQPSLLKSIDFLLIDGTEKEED